MQERWQRLQGTWVDMDDDINAMMRCFGKFSRNILIFQSFTVGSILKQELGRYGFDLWVVREGEYQDYILKRIKTMEGMDIGIANLSNIWKSKAIQNLILA